jgi:hypothetical protein
MVSTEGDNMRIVLAVPLYKNTSPTRTGGRHAGSSRMIAQRGKKNPRFTVFWPPPFPPRSPFFNKRLSLREKIWDDGRARVCKCERREEKSHHLWLHAWPSRGLLPKRIMRLGTNLSLPTGTGGRADSAPPVSPGRIMLDREGMIIIKRPIIALAVCHLPMFPASAAVFTLRPNVCPSCLSWKQSTSNRRFVCPFVCSRLQRLN